MQIEEIIKLSDPEEALTNKERMSRMAKIWELARSIKAAEQPDEITQAAYAAGFDAGAGFIKGRLSRQEKEHLINQVVSCGIIPWDEDESCIVTPGQVEDVIRKYDSLCKPAREISTPEDAVETLRQAVIKIDSLYDQIDTNQQSRIRAMVCRLTAMLEDE